jgi:hypothetical protein
MSSYWWYGAGTWRRSSRSSFVNAPSVLTIVPCRRTSFQDNWPVAQLITGLCSDGKEGTFNLCIVHGQTVNLRIMTYFYIYNFWPNDGARPGPVSSLILTTK